MERPSSIAVRPLSVSAVKIKSQSIPNRRFAGQSKLNSCNTFRDSSQSVQNAALAQCCNSFRRNTLQLAGCNLLFCKTLFLKGVPCEHSYL
jgi:hypothetical protein